MEVHLFNISVFFRHLKFTQNFVWQLDRDEAGVREGDGHLTGGDRPRSRGEGERKRERERVRGWGGEEGLRVEGWRGWETDGDSALAASPRGNKQQIWDLSHREKEMEIRKREGEWSAEKMIFLFFFNLALRWELHSSFLLSDPFSDSTIVLHRKRLISSVTSVQRVNTKWYKRNTMEVYLSSFINESSSVS